MLNEEKGLIKPERTLVPTNTIWLVPAYKFREPHDDVAGTKIHFLEIFLGRVV